jgi:hypothetical protein
VGILDMRDRKHKFNFIVGGERNNKPSCWRDEYCRIHFIIIVVKEMVEGWFI